MKTLAYLLPNLALAALLGRMLATDLARAERRIFLFLAAWLGYSLATLFITWPGLHMIVWAFATPALVDAALAVRKPRLTIFAGALLPLVFTTRIIFARWGEAAAAANACCWFAVLAGITFVLASRAPLDTSHHSSPLRRGVGIYLLLFGGGVQLLAAAGATSPAWQMLLLSSATLVWLALAASIAPTPDALVNPEMLAISFSSLSPVSGVRWTPPESRNRTPRGRQGSPQTDLSACIAPSSGPASAVPNLNPRHKSLPPHSFFPEVPRGC